MPGVLGTIFILSRTKICFNLGRPTGTDGRCSWTICSHQGLSRIMRKKISIAMSVAMIDKHERTRHAHSRRIETFLAGFEFLSFDILSIPLCWVHDKDHLNVMVTNHSLVYSLVTHTMEKQC